MKTKSARPTLHRARSPSASSRPRAARRRARPRCARRRRSSSASPCRSGRRRTARRSGRACRSRRRAGPARTRSAAPRRATPGSTGRGRSPAPGRRPCTNEAGSRSRSSSLPPTKYSGCADVHGWSGATWFGTKSRISCRPRFSSALRAEARPFGPAEAASQPCSRGRSTASRPRRRGVKSGSARPKLSSRLVFCERDRDPAGLRSQTPISQTASKPSAAIASHSAAGHAGEADLLPQPAPAARRARPTC